MLLLSEESLKLAIFSIVEVKHRDEACGDRFSHGLREWDIQRMMGGVAVLKEFLFSVLFF